MKFFDYGSGSVSDLTGGKNIQPAVNSSFLWATDRQGHLNTALQFNEEDYLTIPRSVESFARPNTGFTIIFWLKLHDNMHSMGVWNFLMVIWATV